jgi:hypothetical protein
VDCLTAAGVPKQIGKPVRHHYLDGVAVNARAAEELLHWPSLSMTSARVDVLSAVKCTHPDTMRRASGQKMEVAETDYSFRCGSPSVG